jgi:hypothetical protein
MGPPGPDDPEPNAPVAKKAVTGTNAKGQAFQSKFLVAGKRIVAFRTVFLGERTLTSPLRYTPTGNLL